jgi:hypothetical protein
MRALRQALDAVRGHGEHTRAGDLFLVRGSRSDRRDAAENTGADESTPVQLTEGDVEQTKALNRIADTIERLSAQLHAYHHERAEHLDAIEFLLREMVIGAVPPSAAPPIAFGGVIDPAAIDRAGPESRILADVHPLEVATAVEVRSRFQDRWISGFAITEAVDAPDHCRYRLSRRSDGIPLPILFDAGDVRATTSTFDRQHATD